MHCRYVRQQWNFQHEQTVACGDSGNDIDMLGGKNCAIVVGNAQPDLKAWTDQVCPATAGSSVSSMLGQTVL